MLCVVVRALLSGLAFCLASAAARPAQAAFDLNDPSWEGGSELFDLAKKRFGRERLEVAATLDYSKLTAKDGLVILHPEVPLDHDALSAFMRAGGRVAVIDDYGTGDRFLARFSIFRANAPQAPSKVLRDNAALPIAEPAVQLVAGQEQNRHPITQNVDALVTNHPTVLMHSDLTAVLTIAARGEPNATLAVTGIIGPKVDASAPGSARIPRGRLFAMGDPSAFINVMLRYPGNRHFAEGLLGYLVESDSWGEREGKLYFVANHFEQRGQFGDRGGVLSNMKQALSDTLSDVHDHGLPEPLPLMLAAVGCLLVMAWAVLYAARPRARATPRYSLAEPLVAQGGPAGRIAVLAAPTSDPALGLSELRGAALDLLGERLGLGRGASAQLVLAELDRRTLLEPGRRRELEEAFSELRVIEERILKKQRRLIPPARLEALHKKVMAAVLEIEERIGSV